MGAFARGVLSIGAGLGPGFGPGPRWMEDDGTVRLGCGPAGRSASCGGSHHVLMKWRRNIGYNTRE